MNTRSTFRGFLIGIALIFLAACGQKTETNPPEVARQKAEEIRSATPTTFVRSFADHIVRITNIDKDTFTAIEPDGTFRTYAISAAAKTVDEIIKPDDPNYADYVHMFQNESVIAAIHNAGQYAFIVAKDGTIGQIVNNPAPAALTANVRWHQGAMIVKMEISSIATRLIDVVPTSDIRYNTFAGKYCREEKAK
ncbi:MAG TPA: hypothetical protein VN420_01905 [Candidatus Fimivivens sp.]|nr:hypothetical protein [Candidatus Fimivivens sp.]